MVHVAVPKTEAISSFSYASKKALTRYFTTNGPGQHAAQRSILNESEELQSLKMKVGQAFQQCQFSLNHPWVKSA